MADHEPRRVFEVLANGGLGFELLLDGETLRGRLSIDSTNMPDAASEDTVASVLGVVSGQVSKVSVADMLRALGGKKIIRTPVYFGQQAITTASSSNVKTLERALWGESGKANRIVGIKIVGCESLPVGPISGTTTLTVSDESLGTTNVQTASIGSTETASNYIAADIELNPANPACFVRISAAGGHSGISAFIDIEVTNEV